MNRNKSKFVVMGAGGFLGTNLVSRLLDNEAADVIAFGRNLHTIRRHPRLQKVEGNFSNSKDYSPELANATTVFHLLSSTNVSSSRENPVGDIEENLIPTIEFLELCWSSGVQRVIYVSSGGAIYGNPAQLPVKENDPTWPLTSYGITKLAIERHLYRASIDFGFKTVSLRVSNPFGPHQQAGKNQGAIAHLMKAAITGSKFELWGDGQVIRDYVFVNDVIDAILLASEYTGSEQIFNIGSGIGTSLNELISKVEKTTSLMLNIQNSPSRIFDVKNNVLDISLAKRVLGWSPTTSLETGLRETFTWWESQTYLK